MKNPNFNFGFDATDGINIRSKYNPAYYASKGKEALLGARQGAMQAARAAGIGYQVGRSSANVAAGRAGFGTAASLAAGAMLIRNMSAANATLAKTVAYGTKFITYGIPAAAKWIATNVAKIGANVFKVLQLAAGKLPKFLWTAIKWVAKTTVKTVGAVVKGVRSTNRSLNKFNKDLATELVDQDPSRFYKYGRSGRTKARSVKGAVKHVRRNTSQVADVLKLGEVGLAGWGINTLVKRAKERKDEDD